MLKTQLKKSFLAQMLINEVIVWVCGLCLYTTFVIIWCYDGLVIGEFGGSSFEIIGMIGVVSCLLLGC